MTDLMPPDTTFITDNLHPDIKPLITENTSTFNREFFLVGEFLVIRAELVPEVVGNVNKYITIRLTPVITGTEDASSDTNILMAYLGRSKYEATKSLVDDPDDGFGSNVPTDFDEAKLAVYFTQLTPEIIEYFKSHSLDIPTDPLAIINVNLKPRYDLPVSLNRLSDLEYFLVDKTLILRAKNSTFYKECNYVMFRFNPAPILGVLMSFGYGETYAQIADMSKKGLDTTAGFDEENLKPFFSQLTPEIIEYFITHPLRFHEEQQNND